MLKTLKFLTLPVLSLVALTGCNSGDGGDGGDTSEPTSSGESLPYSEDQVKNKLQQLGETSGFEITLVGESDGESEGTVTFGMKGKAAWLYTDEGKGGYKIAEDKLYIYTYDEDLQTYEPTEMPVDNPQESFDLYVEGATSSLYYAYDLTTGGDFTKVGGVTHAGRAATEYRYVFAGYGVSVQWKVIVDNELGITLYWGGSGSSVDGDSGSASLDVTVFKTGSAVVVPF